MLLCVVRIFMKQTLQGSNQNVLQVKLGKSTNFLTFFPFLYIQDTLKGTLSLLKEIVGRNSSVTMEKI